MFSIFLSVVSLGGLEEYSQRLWLDWPFEENFLLPWYRLGRVFYFYQILLTHFKTLGYYFITLLLFRLLLRSFSLRPIPRLFLRRFTSLWIFTILGLLQETQGKTKQGLDRIFKEGLNSGKTGRQLRPLYWGPISLYLVGLGNQGKGQNLYYEDQLFLLTEVGIRGPIKHFNFFVFQKFLEKIWGVKALQGESLWGIFESPNFGISKGWDNSS